MSNLSRPNPLVIRCPDCGGALARCEDESLCPDCVSYTLAAEPPHFVATTSDGTYLHEGPDLEALVAWVLGLLDDGSDEDLIVCAGARVVAVVRGRDRTAIILP
jgi:hypothetical protein